VSLVTTKCENCGEQFDQSGQEKYCTDECLRAGRSQGAKAQTECASCGESFEYYPSRRTGKYCSPCYADEDKETVTRLTETANPRWNGGKRVCQCAVCGARVERYPSQIGETVLCSKACHSTWLSDEFTGEGHPNWDGGGNEDYGKGWRAVRQQALERDGYQCLVCGRTDEEMGRNPDVHHITPVKWFITSDGHTREDAHYLENVISLCISCHRKAEFGKIEANYLRSLIEDL